VHGNITVPARCELHAGSQLIGDLKAVRVALEDGATFLSKLEVTPNNAALTKGCGCRAKPRAAENWRSPLRSSEWLLEDESK
jgi:hypothetical protein